MNEKSTTNAETPSSKVVALRRFGRGIIGAWLAVVPFGLFFLDYKFKLVAINLLLASATLLCYIIALLKWRKQRYVFLKAVALDTILMYIFASVVGVVVGIMSAFSDEPWDFSPGIYMAAAYLGFWILEIRHRRADPRSRS